MDLSMSAVIGIIIGILVLTAAIYGLRTADKRRKAEALRRAKQAEKEAQARAARRAKRRAKKIAQLERELEHEREERERYEEATRTQVLYADLQAELTETDDPDDTTVNEAAIDETEVVVEKTETEVEQAESVATETEAATEVIEPNKPETTSPESAVENSGDDSPKAS